MVRLMEGAKKFVAKLNARGKPLDEFGREVLDPTPMAPPVGYRPAPSLAEQIRQMVRSERLAFAAREAGAETFEEADDFDIPDDPLDPSTPYEANFEGGSVRELKERAAKAAAEAAEAEAREAGAAVPPAPKGGSTVPPGADGDGSEAVRLRKPRADVDD